MYDLTRTDYVVLEFVKKHEPASKEDIVRCLSGKVDSLEYRLDMLSRLRYSDSGVTTNSSYLEQEFGSTDSYGGTEPLGIYHLSGLGRKAIQDHEESVKAERKAVWRSWIQWGVPIAISLFSLLNSIFRWIEVSK